MDEKCAAFAARNRRARIGFGSAADDAAGMLVQLAVKIGKSGFDSAAQELVRLSSHTVQNA